MKKITAFVLLFVGLILASCSHSGQKPIVISTNAWVGYSPLFYAREMGWLKESKIELISVVSLGESMHLYDAGASDVFTGTQHEFEKQREQYPDLIPIILFDRSNGGDAVMSNRSIEELCRSKEAIDVYMEIDSVNEELMNYFVAKYGISKSRLKLHNRVQDEIQLMTNTPSAGAVLIVTYDPYNMTLEKNGFSEVASTRDNNDLFVVDAMYARSSLYYANKKQFEKLNAVMARSIDALKKDPRGYYTKVKPYLDNPTYEEFVHMLQNIEWIHGKPSPQLQERLNEIQFPTKELM